MHKREACVWSFRLKALGGVGGWQTKCAKARKKEKLYGTHLLKQIFANKQSRTKKNKVKERTATTKNKNKQTKSSDRSEMLLYFPLILHLHLQNEK